MRKLLLILILFMFAGESYSQDYHKFPSSNAFWNYLRTGSLSPPYEWTVIDSLGGEVTIGAHTYVKVYHTALGNAYVVGAIRDDTLEKKVYFSNYSDEIVLYDFNLNVGDTIHYTTNLYYYLTYYKVVNYVDSVTINGEYRKRWHFTNSLNYFPDIWIEGIGSVYRYGLLYPNDPDIVLDASTPYFGCFSHDTIVYIDSSSCVVSCPCYGWLVGVDERSDEYLDMKIFPNPTSGWINFHHLETQVTYRIVDMTSQPVKAGYIESNRINVMDLPTGVYILELMSDSFSSKHKIIKY